MFGWLINKIAFGFHASAWYIFAWPFLSVIKIITSLFSSISFNLLQGIFFKGQNFSFGKVPIAFVLFGILAAVGIIFFLLFRLGKSYFTSRGENQNRENELKVIILKTISAVLFPILFVVFLFVLLIGTNMILIEIKNSLNFTNDLNLSLIKGAIGDMELNEEEITRISNGNPMTFNHYVNLDWGVGIRLILLVFVSALLVTWLLGSTLLALVANLAQMFYQLILLPVFSVSQIVDDGKLFKKYLNGFWAKFWVVVIYQVAFLFFFIWVEYSVNGWDNINLTGKSGVASWFLNFVFSLVMIYGGGIAVKTIAQEFSGYFGGEGFVRSQQEWAHRTAKGMALTAGLLAASPGLLRKGIGKIGRLTGYYDTKKAQIKEDYRKGRISRGEKMMALKEHAERKKELGQTFRQGWEKNKDKNFLVRTWAAKEAYKEGKDTGKIESVAYKASGLRSKITDFRKEKAFDKVNKAKQELDKIDSKKEPEKYKKALNKFDKLSEKAAKAYDRQEKQNQRFIRRSDNLYTTAQINNQGNSDLERKYMQKGLGDKVRDENGKVVGINYRTESYDGKVINQQQKNKDENQKATEEFIQKAIADFDKKETQEKKNEANNEKTDSK